MRFVFLFLVVLVAACKSIPQPKGIAAQYKSQLTEPALSTIRVKTFISYDSLLGRFCRVGQRIISFNESSSLGFPYSGTLEQSVRFRRIGSNQLQVIFPMKWEAKPQIAGISAGTISAKSVAGISFQLKGKSLSNYQFDDVQLTNQWTEKPSVKVLGFPVQVGAMVDQLIIPKYPSLASELKNQLNQWIAPDKLNSIWGSGIQLPAGFNIGSLGVDLQNLQVEQHGLQGDLVIQSRLILGSGLAPKTIKPLMMPLKVVDNSLAFSVYFTLDEIRGMLASQLKTDLAQISLALSQDKQSFACRMEGKGKPSMNLRFVPILIDSSAIGIQVQELELEGLGFWKSIFKNNINRRVVAGIQSQRMTTDQMSYRIPSQIQGLSYSNLNLSLESINYSLDSIQVLGRIRADWTLRK
jgi:hypothetical protein